MKRTRYLLLGALALAALAVLWLARANRLPPPLPRDPVHDDFVSSDTCLICHGPSGVHPQPPSHPVGRDCLRCHARRPSPRD